MWFKISYDPVYGEVIDLDFIQSDLYDVDVSDTEIIYDESLSDLCNRTIEKAPPSTTPIGKRVL